MNNLPKCAINVFIKRKLNYLHTEASETQESLIKTGKIILKRGAEMLNVCASEVLVNK